MFFCMVFYGDRVGAGGCFSLKDGQIDGLVADKEPGVGPAADEAGFVAVEIADVGAAAGKAAFATIGLWQFVEGDVAPGVAAVETAGYEESAVDGIADDDATVDVPKFHCVEEHSFCGILINQLPGLAAVGRFEDVGG